MACPAAVFGVAERARIVPVTGNPLSMLARRAPLGFAAPGRWRALRFCAPPLLLTLDWPNPNMS